MKGSGAPSHDPFAVVTPLTPPRPDVRLDARPGHEVTLLPTVLGKGGFGRVVEGMYEGQTVAVKLILDDSLDAWGLPVAANYCSKADDKKAAPDSKVACPGNKESRESALSELSASLAQEVAVLGRCRHPNILTLIAACLQPPRLCLVMERMETSLDKLLYGRPGVLLPMEQVLSIALDVARGLEYLHPTVLHRDLKPGNVLLNGVGTDKLVAKLADFGLSRLRFTVVAFTANPEVGTPEYMAPELYSPDNSAVSDKVDVYAFGVLLWAMLSGQRPWAGLEMVAIAVRVHLLKQRPPVEAVPPERFPRKLQRLILACWDQIPDRRPAASELVKDLLLVQHELELASGVGQTGADAE
ncbi:hypothetical protein GPECTOR_20g511 [Gonium pectorale]|uniref:Protein kinase domain-containing protein n=1 Tax=Gonium pectorale TaxID=33097 RepID=A0A150GIM0_GONPE|nr:hypothetical protein GPECTOR_20g511 [Gonium pectorale]|eukprot:KXZ49654.1 hypothetical protein GPECTOR_20g511 [Gonium pectorale]